jgi:hypothetical protein
MQQHAGTKGAIAETSTLNCRLAVPICISKWTQRGAQLLLRTQTKVLNGDLEATFRGWYTAFRCEVKTRTA